MNDFRDDIAAVNSIAAVPTILDVVCRTTGMGFAAVARVTESRWIACSVKDNIAFGLAPGGELKIETTICHEIRQNRQPVIINHVAEDETYRDHHTPATYGLQSYISMPIILPDGTFFGTLCAIDPRPAQVNTPEIVGMFKLFAELIAFHLDSIERLALSQSQLVEERKESDLREQFIAVLGHDLRNPLGAIATGSQILERMPLGERGLNVVGLIRESASRMLGLIDDVLDFARGRLGGGFKLSRNQDEMLTPVLNQIIEELRSSNPDRRIEADIQLHEPLDCDRARIAQLFSNILGNALAYGRVDMPVIIRALVTGDNFELSVANSGKPISAAAMERLFQPFSRGEVRPHQQGLGLGLYIASEIASSHGGKLTVTSTPQETKFTFRMPIRHVADAAQRRSLESAA